MDEMHHAEWLIERIIFFEGAPTVSKLNAIEGSSEVNQFSSKFDYYQKGYVKLTQGEKLGLTLFNGKGKCAKCHISTGIKPLFTDFTFDNLGVPMNPENPVYDYDPGFIDKGLGGFLLTREDYKTMAGSKYRKTESTYSQECGQKTRL
jgi:cytochrome c peroxidase